MTLRRASLIAPGDTVRLEIVGCHPGVWNVNAAEIREGFLLLHVAHTFAAEIYQIKLQPDDLIEVVITP